MVFVGPSNSVDFMDITMEIVDGKFEVILFEKTLKLYIPHKSGHPPCLLTGLIQLCYRSTLTLDTALKEYL